MTADEHHSGEIEITPQMVEVGAERLRDLEGCAGATYVAEEVYRAMLAHAPAPLPLQLQTDREIAEMIARFRTPPGFSWSDLANDIETILKTRPRIC